MPGFLKPNAVKDYIKTAQKLRSADDAVGDMVDAFNSAIDAVI